MVSFWDCILKDEKILCKICVGENDWNFLRDFKVVLLLKKWVCDIIKVYETFDYNKPEVLIDIINDLKGK